jgi:hypothetical protein
MAFRCTSRHTNTENETEGRRHQMSITAPTFDGKKRWERAAMLASYEEEAA